MTLLNNATFELNGFNSGIGLEKIIMLVMMFVGVVVGVVFVTLGQTTHSNSECEARTRKTCLTAAQDSTCRCVLTRRCVMPIIFAQSLLMIPPFIFSYFGGGEGFFSGIMGGLGALLGDPTSMVYNLVYIAMIYFFCYFWTAITFNPKEISGQHEGQRNIHPWLPPGSQNRRLS